MGVDEPNRYKRQGKAKYNTKVLSPGMDSMVSQHQREKGKCDCQDFCHTLYSARMIMRFAWPVASPTAFGTPGSL
jgi:hypothetical protein